MGITETLAARLSNGRNTLADTGVDSGTRRLAVFGKLLNSKDARLCLTAAVVIIVVIGRMQSN